MRTTALALLIGVAAAGGLATPAPAVTTAKKPVTVVVSTPKHRFSPNVIHMPGGVPVRLVIRNPSGTTHEFRSEEFFAGAKINDADAHVVDVNRIRVPKYSSASVRLIARPGRYEVKSTETLDAAAGMDGEIIVD
jgi:uncharacterized cupredoxin-like copper-binding protein